MAKLISGLEYSKKVLTEVAGGIAHVKEQQPDFCPCLAIVQVCCLPSIVHSSYLLILWRLRYSP